MVAVVLTGTIAIAIPIMGASAVGALGTVLILVSILILGLIPGLVMILAVNSLLTLMLPLAVVRALSPAHSLAPGTQAEMASSHRTVE